MKLHSVWNAFGPAMDDPLHCLGQSTHPDIDDVTRNLAYV